MDDLLAWLLRALPVLTLLGGWFGHGAIFRNQMRKDRADIAKGQAEVQQARDAHQLEIDKFQTGTDAGREAKDREWLDKAIELGAEGRSEAERGLAIDYLMALVALGSTNPRVTGPLEIMLRRQAGMGYIQAQAEIAAGRVPKAVMPVVPLEGDETRSEEADGA